MNEENLGSVVSGDGEFNILLLLREYLEKRICSNCKADMNLLPEDNSLFIKYRCPKCGAWRMECIQLWRREGEK